MIRRRGGGRHLTFGKAVPFAGGRWNLGLGRSVSSVEVSSSAGGRTGDSGCPVDSRGGERRQRAPPKHTHPTRIGLRARDPRRTGDASFARSTDPCSSIVTRGCVGQLTGCHATRQSSRSGKPAQAGGTGPGDRHVGPSAARRSSPPSQGGSRDGSEQEGGRGLRPCEETRAPDEVLVRLRSCRSR